MDRNDHFRLERHAAIARAVLDIARRRLRVSFPAIGKLDGSAPDKRPAVLFLCVHNAGRSQMALGWLSHLGGDNVVGYSGGSAPANEINPVAITAMNEVGIDISNEFPKPWTDDIVRATDVVVLMGCGDACPVYPGKRYVEWTLDDPAGQDIDAVRNVRDDIRAHVENLLVELGITTPA
jgi:arsenate reductase (thioredoxin)